MPRTRIQFESYVAVLEAFNQEYGRYPAFFQGRESVNLAELPDIKSYVAAFSGDSIDGVRNHNAARAAGNRKCITFYSFPEHEWQTPKGWDYPTIVDGFGNPNIVLVVDQNGDGKITLPIDGVPTEVNGRVVVYSIADDPKQAFSTYRP
ncbi:hypothetical protein [Cerasicoccus maritimus]|uniref:hypothetical protein n=1 Tax=Cerasicoccus maritimus TaxID=490089 RepID=UPI002852532F|nr:hypothetical protein [Cerasicoccus maritimus]